MKTKELHTLIDYLWNLYAHPDSHGYRDWMGEDAFGSAIAYAVRKAENPQEEAPNAVHSGPKR